MTAKRIVITGTSRGLGIEFCRQWSEQGREIAALVRDPDRADALQELAQQHAGLSVHRCDVADTASVTAAVHSVEQCFGGVDLVLNNAGANGRVGQDIGGLDFDDLRQLFEINTLGPLRVTEAFLPLLRRGETRVLAHITSRMGSIGDNGSGGWFGYRMSKAALNMASKNLAISLAGEGIASVVLHPGWVQTDMGGQMAPLTAKESVRDLIEVIDGIDPAASGTFLDRDGTVIPW